MTQPHHRRIAASLAALVLVTGLASGCTAEAWRYDIPPGAGVVEDAGPIKARSILLLADAEGKGLLMGSLFTDDPVELVGVAVAAQQPDGSYAEPVTVDISGEVGVQEPLEFGGTESVIDGANLHKGLLATVLMQFSDGTTMTVEPVVVSSEENSYAESWDAAFA